MKKVWFLIVSLLLLGAIPATIMLVNQKQEVRKKAAPATTLAITPASLAKKVGDTFSMEVVIDTGENQVVAVELHVTFDPSKLEAQTINNGTLFSNILASGSVESGAASMTIGAANSKEPVRGTGTVAVILFTAIAKTDSPTAVKLASNTFVGGLGEGSVNILVGTTPATVTITETLVQSTPTPTPILTPTPTATVSAQPSPAATSSASLAVVSPSNDSTTTEDKPTIRGKAAPGATVTVTIYSTPQTITLTADANGNWSYTPDTALEAGPHNIVASVTDQTGQTQTATTAFIVASSTLAGQEVPVSGTVETTMLLIMIGITFITVGVIFPKNLWLFH